ncbi:hypothetical protein Meth11DRAFT_1568 [Methylophilaceae bacterium 11]|nr:hypothetical protein Meth11DRAFT_1568 [Methylophilaceae bacterium 11]
MRKSAEIDAFALCSSALVAPAVLVLFGLIGAWSSKASFFSVIFWQVILAIECAGAYLAVSLPIAWLLWRLFPAFCTKQPPNVVPLLFAVGIFLISVNARFFGVTSVGPIEPEIFSFMVGVIMNAIAFVWLHRRALTHHSSGTPNGAP